jgi:hypothetical protein
MPIHHFLNGLGSLFLLIGRHGVTACAGRQHMVLMSDTGTVHLSTLCKEIVQFPHRRTHRPGYINGVAEPGVYASCDVGYGFRQNP